MKILIADDSATSRSLLESSLRKWGHEVVTVADGNAAWDVLQAKDAPLVAVLDWMMPGLDGVEVCRRARARGPSPPLYIALLTARTRSEDMAEALGSGADDFVRKPFDPMELRARVGAGLRIVELQQELARRVAELEGALARVNELQGILPICSYCKKIRNEKESWQQVEAYVAAHSSARFSHGVCPECAEKVYRPQMEALRKKKRDNTP